MATHHFHPFIKTCARCLLRSLCFAIFPAKRRERERERERETEREGEKRKAKGKKNAAQKKEGKNVQTLAKMPAVKG